jgi:hypothetical protein
VSDYLIKTLLPRLTLLYWSPHLRVPWTRTHVCDWVNRKVAIKKIKMGGVAEAMDGVPRDAVKEIKFLQEIKHENVCQVGLFPRPCLVLGVRVCVCVRMRVSVRVSV